MPWAFIYADSLRLEGGSVGGFVPATPGTSRTGSRSGSETACRRTASRSPASSIHDVDGGYDGTCGGTAARGSPRRLRSDPRRSERDDPRLDLHRVRDERRDRAAVLEGARLGPVTIENNAFGRVLHPGSAIELGDCGGGDACTGPMIVRANTIVEGGVNGAAPGRRSPSRATSSRPGRAATVSPTPQRLPDGLVGSVRHGRSVVPTCSTPGRRRGLPSYHLAATDRCARNAGAASGAAVDIDGDARPADEAPDAGADQWAPAALSGDEPASRGRT